MPAPLSDHGKLNAARRDLSNLRASTADQGIRSRCNILIANLDLLKVSPHDKYLLAQFAKNTRDLERYKAAR